MYAENVNFTLLGFNKTLVTNFQTNWDVLYKWNNSKYTRTVETKDADSYLQFRYITYYILLQPNKSSLTDYRVYTNKGFAKRRVISALEGKFIQPAF